MYVQEAIDKQLNNTGAWGRISIHYNNQILFAHYLHGKLDGEKLPSFITNAIVERIEEDPLGTHIDIRIFTKGDNS